MPKSVRYSYTMVQNQHVDCPGRILSTLYFPGHIYPVLFVCLSFNGVKKFKRSELQFHIFLASAIMFAIFSSTPVLY